MLELQDAQVQAEAEQTGGLGKVPRVISNPFLAFSRGDRGCCRMGSGRISPQLHHFHWVWERGRILKLKYSDSIQHPSPWGFAGSGARDGIPEFHGLKSGRGCFSHSFLQD